MVLRTATKDEMFRARVRQSRQALALDANLLRRMGGRRQPGATFRPREMKL
jgi:hypothetical protein